MATPRTLRSPRPEVAQAVLTEQVQGIQSDIADIKQAVQRVDAGLQAVARIEDRQLSLIQTMERDRLAQAALEERVRAIEQRTDTIDSVPKLQDRLGVIEVKMPQLEDLRKWVISGMLGALAMMGAALVSLVMNPRPVLINQPPVTLTAPATAPAESHAPK
jgi:hypothetical protein